MALTEELPIFRAVSRLLNQIAPLTSGFPKFYKYSLGTRLWDLCLDMSELIYEANSSYEKTARIGALLGKLQRMKMLMRLTVEQRILSERQYAHVALTMDEIGRQATAWKRRFAGTAACTEKGGGAAAPEAVSGNVSGTAAVTVPGTVSRFVPQGVPSAGSETAGGTDNDKRQ